MGGGAGAAEDVDHDEVGRTDQSGGQAVQHLPSVPIADANTRVARQRNLRAHEIHQFALKLDYLLPRSGPAVVDVAGEGQGAGAQVHRGDRLARHPELVDDVPDARDVLEVQLPGVVRADMRLRRAVDHEHVAALHPAVRLDDREVTALLEEDVRMLGHLSILAAWEGNGSPPVLHPGAVARMHAPREC